MGKKESLFLRFEKIPEYLIMKIPFISSLLNTLDISRRAQFHGVGLQTPEESSHVIQLHNRADGKFYGIADKQKNDDVGARNVRNAGMCLANPPFAHVPR